MNATDINTSVAPWWKDSIVYQVWPASFYDSNGDGIGDLNGITEKLDHIKSLGVDVVWLSPHYASPLDDMGYDISNYEDVNQQFGSMEDMERLICELKKRDIKIIVDLVINHTSSEHQWFKESRSSKDHPKRSWYIWKDAPNNWRSNFSGSSWEFDDTTEQYYLHLYAKSQPDLNWENPEMRTAIYKSALEFWYQKGVSGFRIDTARLYSKVQSYENAPVTVPGSEFQPYGRLCDSGPRIHEFHKEMYEQVTSKYDAMTVGEVGRVSKELAFQYVSAKEKEMNMLFLFDVTDVGNSPVDRFDYRPNWKLTEFKDAIEKQSAFVFDEETGEKNDAWSTVYIENHDQPRAVSRFGSTKSVHLWRTSAKMIAVLQVTLTGTLFIYQGQEIGMVNIPSDWGLEDYLDIQTINYWKKLNSESHTELEKAIMKVNTNMMARDNARTPVQWDSSSNAGFSTGTPWMKVNENYKNINVASQEKDPDSILNFYRDAIQVRKEHSQLLTHGSFKILDYDNLQVFSYIKSHDNRRAQVVLNFSEEELNYDFPQGDVILSNVDTMTKGKLQPFEARVILLE